MKEREQACLHWLCTMPEAGGKTALLLLKLLGSAENLYAASEQYLKALFLSRGHQELLNGKKWEALLLWKRKKDLEQEYREIRERGICLLGILDEGYPARLKKLAVPPVVLYYKGRLPEEEKPSVGIIGARECSEYGAFAAKGFSGKMAACGVNIISGMARGIDGIAQQAALEAGGGSFGVLGCGADVCYPSSNRELYQALLQAGGVLSPYPPGTRPLKRLFPYRNQIVAGLSDALLVVEARQKSGTLITVDMALEQGKDVYAVPGRLTDRLSDGCNLLIRQGAGIALSPEDILAELSILANRKKEEKGENGEKRKKKEKEGEEKEGKERKETEEEKEGPYAFLSLDLQSPDEILEKMRKAGLSITLPQLLFELIQLCMEGKAKQTGGNYFTQIPDIAKF